MLLAFARSVSPRQSGRRRVCGWLGNDRAADRHAPGAYDAETDRGGETAGRSRNSGPHGRTCGDGHVRHRRGIDLGAHHIAQGLHGDQPLLCHGLGDDLDRHCAWSADRWCSCGLGAQGVLASLFLSRRSGRVENCWAIDRPHSRNRLLRLLGRERAARRRAMEWRYQFWRRYRVSVR